MAEINITQNEANTLIAMDKYCVDNTPWQYPGQGQSITIPLISGNKREDFLLDISRGRIDLLKGKYQNRARQSIILVRLDFGGSPHRNPDDQEILSPHLHVYREGYGDKWATPVPQNSFSNVSDRWQTLNDFMKYCNITQPPLIQKGLFI